MQVLLKMRSKLYICLLNRNLIFFTLLQVATQPSNFHVSQAAAQPVSTIPAVTLSQTQPAKVNIIVNIVQNILNMTPK